MQIAMVNWVNAMALFGVCAIALVAMSFAVYGWRKSWLVEKHDLEPEDFSADDPLPHISGTPLDEAERAWLKRTCEAVKDDLQDCALTDMTTFHRGRRYRFQLTEKGDLLVTHSAMRLVQAPMVELTDRNKEPM